MKIFRKGYDITLNRVHDTIRIKENGESLQLTVSADPMRIVAGLNKAQKKLSDLVSDDREPSEEEIKEAAEYFATVIFGQEQAGKMMAFYNNDAACVINVCGTYFRERLAQKISKMQKKIG